MKVLTKTLTAGMETAFNFDVYGHKFTIKNFTAGDIYVSDVQGSAKLNCIKLASGMGQNIAINELYPIVNATSLSNVVSVNTIYITADVAGNVEIQCTSYR